MRHITPAWTNWDLDKMGLGQVGTVRIKCVISLDKLRRHHVDHEWGTLLANWLSEIIFAAEIIRVFFRRVSEVTPVRQGDCIKR